MLKILTEINILWFLIPLYAVALIMMIFAPKLFVGLAFDSEECPRSFNFCIFDAAYPWVAQAVAATSPSGGQPILVNGFGIIAFISVTH